MEASVERSVEFGAELRRLRGELSLRELARRACCGKSTVSDLETGRRMPTARMAASLDRALGSGGILQALAGQSRTDGEPSGEGDGEVWRREFLKAVGSLGAVTVLGPEVQQASQSELLAAHADLRAAHGRLDNLRGARSVYSQAVMHHREVVGWLRSVRSAGERARVAALAADTGGFAGFLSCDLGMPVQAATAYQEAADLAEQAGDVSCQVNLLGQMSRMLADKADFTTALSLSERALAVAGTRAHPAVRSWLHAVRAHHRAGTGDGRAAQLDLKAAWKLLGRAEDGQKPPYIGYMGEAELYKWTGHVMVQLSVSRPECVRSGVEALEQARTLWPASSVRGSAEVLASSARLYASAGERDEAHRLAEQSVRVSMQTESARNLAAALVAQSAAVGKA